MVKEHVREKVIANIKSSQKNRHSNKMITLNQQLQMKMAENQIIQNHKYL